MLLAMGDWLERGVAAAGEALQIKTKTQMKWIWRILEHFTARRSWRGKKKSKQGKNIKSWWLAWEIVETRTCMRSGKKTNKKMKSYARLPLITQKKYKKIPFSHSHQKKSAFIVPNTALLKKKGRHSFGPWTCPMCQWAIYFSTSADNNHHYRLKRRHRISLTNYLCYLAQAEVVLR